MVVVDDDYAVGFVVVAVVIAVVAVVEVVVVVVIVVDDVAVVVGVTGVDIVGVGVGPVGVSAVAGVVELFFGGGSIRCCYSKTTVVLVDVQIGRNSWCVACFFCSSVVVYPTRKRDVWYVVIPPL